MHSVFSDGSKTPEELVEEGVAIGLKAMALTDHDTVGGVPRFLEAAAKAGMPVLTGVEVSADVEKGTLHVLGYGVDPKNRTLIEHLRWIREGRDERNREILHKLNRLGMRISHEELKQYAGADAVGRPHIARALIAKGYVRDKRDAFDRLLAKGKPAYAERRRLLPEATMELIRTAGGLPVIAHPFTLKLSMKEFTEFARRLQAAGLAGIECYYSEHSPEMQRKFKSAAEELGLLATGGSDYHGELSPGIRMGRGTGPLSVPDSVWDEILAAAGRNS
ncbi:MAG TPA: PHP domain-containing protein [Kiritimatiellia bacterium]|nr:PHP domain-containing protein [Kiritimatiellia bacterium]